MKIPTIKNLIKKIINFKKWLIFKKVEKNTKVGHERLYNVYNLSEEIEKNKIIGSFVECGVWKGGAAAIMAYVANKYKSGRAIWLFDSFEGLPAPKDIDGVKARKCYEEDRNLSSVDDVKSLFFQKFHFDKNNINIIKGWFDKTLLMYREKIGPIAILRLDGDWYESTKTCLENLYDSVISGGYVIIDDYGCWEGCKIAVNEFLAKRGIKVNLIKIDKSGYYFQKPLDIFI